MPDHSFEMSVEELAKLQFLRGIPQDGRIIVCTSYYLDGQPYFGMPDPSTGQMIVMPNTTPTWGGYWSIEQIASDQDTYFDLLDTIAQHFSFPRLQHPMRAIELDLSNLAAILEKFVAVWEYYETRPQADTAVRLMYLTDLEYFFGVCRSLIDLLHDCHRHLYGKQDGKTLPETFGSFVDKDLSTLVTKYKLPAETEAYLGKVKPLFGHIRGVRDAIFHQGRSLELIFITDAGPGICIDYAPFDVFKAPFENDEHFTGQMQTNRIGSLFYLVLKTLDNVIEATNEFAAMLKAVFQPLPPRYTKTDYRYFLRGPSFVLLNERTELLRRCWLSPARQFIGPRLNARTHLLHPRSTGRPDQFLREGVSVAAEGSLAASDTDTGERDRWVRENAYYRYLDEQRRGDRACQHWYDAEREYLCDSILKGRPLNSDPNQRMDE